MIDEFQKECAIVDCRVDGKLSENVGKTWGLVEWSWQDNWKYSTGRFRDGEGG